MTLLPCEECSKSISSLARACPNCGAPNPNYVADSKVSNKEWTTSEDEKLLSLYKKNIPEFALAKILKKRATKIRERIIFLMKK